MPRIAILLLLFLLCESTYAAVQAYSVADDNFDMPDHLVRINLETGEYVSMGQIADPYIALEGMSMSVDGSLFGADDNTKTLVQIIPSEGRAFPVANANQNFGFGSVPESYDFGLSFACDDKLYMVVKHTQELFQVNSDSGVASLVGSTGHNFTSLAAWGDELYSVASGDYNLYTINPDNGESTVVGSMGDLGGDIDLAGSGLAFDADGQLWMVINLRLSDPLNPFPSRIFKINTDTGRAQLVAETLVGIESLAIAPPGGCSIGGGGGGQAIPIPVNSTSGQLLLIMFLLIFGVIGVRNNII